MAENKLIEFPGGIVTGGNERFEFGEFPHDIFVVRTRDWKGNGDRGDGVELPASPTMTSGDVGRSLSYIRSRGLELQQIIPFPCESGEISAVVIVARKLPSANE